LNQERRGEHVFERFSGFGAVPVYNDMGGQTVKHARFHLALPAGAAG
jgi:hypothetical protein